MPHASLERFIWGPSFAALLPYNLAFLLIGDSVISFLFFPFSFPSFCFGAILALRCYRVRPIATLIGNDLGVDNHGMTWVLITMERAFTTHSCWMTMTWTRHISKLAEWKWRKQFVSIYAIITAIDLSIFGYVIVLFSLIMVSCYLGCILRFSMRLREFLLIVHLRLLNKILSINYHALTQRPVQNFFSLFTIGSSA